MTAFLLLFCIFRVNYPKNCNLNNADVVKKFIFRYLSVPLPDGVGNILMTKTNRDIFNKIIELNKFLNNVCIIRVNRNAMDV
jgi:hypothetical protein